MKDEIKILYVIREEFPTFRSDVKSLFGKYLARLGIIASIVAVQATREDDTWNSGNIYLVRQRGHTMLHRVASGLKILWLVARHAGKFDAIQVRDQTFIGLFALCVALARRKRFYFWMSWPFAEDDIEKSWYLGSVMRFRRLFYLMRGYLQRLVLYGIVLRLADHVFVQSDEMKRWLAGTIGREHCLTAVPMGVDLEEVDIALGQNHFLSAVSKERTLGYLGKINRLRMSDVFFDAIRIVLQRFPDASILFAGNGQNEDDIEWLITELRKMDLEGRYRITGWLPSSEAWRELSGVKVGLNILRRTLILDTSSPTKVLEYAAMGIPSVATDIPDQKIVLNMLECGLCVPYDARLVADAIATLLSDDELCDRLAMNGLKRVGKFRGYNIIAKNLAERYRALSADESNA